MTEQENGLRPLSATEREILEEVTSSWLGHVSEDVEAYLDARGIDATARLTSRLGVVGGDVPPEFRKYTGMLAIPYLDRHGDPLTIRFRCLGEHDHRAQGHGKYLTMKDDPARMYGIRSIFDAGDVIHITEGELDSIVLNRIGLHSVAIPGANAFKRHHRRMLAGFSRIHVWGDPDEAGAEFNKAITRAMRQARPVPIRGGDVTDTFIAGGADALLALLEE